MDGYVKNLIAQAMSVERPSPDECAVEKYTQMLPHEINALTAKRVAQLAEYVGFDKDEHADWIHSGITCTEPNGIRLLDIFFLKYPVPVLPEPHELEIEYSWKRRHQPEFLTGIDSFDKYMEMLARMLYFSLDSYMRALKEWANGGRPTELADCLQNAERQSLLRFKRVQARRTKDKEQSYMKCQRARAPAHLLARIEAGIHRENLALHLIGQSLSSL